MIEITLPRLAATLIAVVALTVLPSRPTMAQPPDAADGGTVTGTGKVTLSRQPNVLRMTIELPAEGKDVKEAIANLKAERKTLANKLEKLGAAGESVTFGEPRVGGAYGGAMSMQQRMMRQVMRMQRAGNRAVAKAAADKDAPPPKVAVSLSVIAEWPIEGESPEELIVAAYTLRETLRAGGLSKPPEAKELTPEEQEQMEELAGMMDEDGEAAAPGEPSFEFVARFTAAERDKAMAEAFAKAKADAARLAAATGGSLGALRTVSGSASSEGYDEDDDYGFQRAMLQQLGVAPAGEAGVDEATADEPGAVSLEVTVTAGFGLN